MAPRTKLMGFLIGGCTVQSVLLNSVFGAPTVMDPVTAAVTSTTQDFVSSPALEAPTGFDLQTNGFVDQATMDEAREDFEEVETVEDGLGPVFNAESVWPVMPSHSLVVIASSARPELVISTAAASSSIRAVH